MTIPAGMLTESINFKPRGRANYPRRAHVNNYSQRTDEPLFSDIELMGTVRYDSETKALREGDLFDYDNSEYKITTITTRRHDRLIDIRGARV